MKKFMLICAPVSSRSGYGDHARDLVWSFIEHNKYDIKIQDVPWGSTPRNALDKNNSKHKKILDCFLTENQLPKQPDIWIQVTVPNEFQPIGKYNIGITAGIETNMASPQWIEGCNRMNKIIVPSMHSKYVIEKSTYDKREQGTDVVVEKLKCEREIDVLFEGLDLEAFRKTNEINKDIKK